MSELRKRAQFFGVAPLPNGSERVALLMDALGQIPTRVTLDPDVHLDPGETSVEMIGVVIAAHLADAPDRQRIRVEALSGTIALDTPIRDAARDELGWSLALCGELAAVGRALRIAEAWSAHSWIIVAECSDTSSGEVDLVAARAQTTGPFALEGGRVSVSNGWITAEPVVRTREWDRNAYALIARLRRGERWPEHHEAPPDQQTGRGVRVEERQDQAVSVGVPSYLLHASTEIQAAQAPVPATSPVEALTALTEPLDLEHRPDLVARGPIPFGGTTTPERLAVLREQAPAAPLEPLPGAEETAMVVPSAALRDIIAAPAHPFQPPGPAAPSRPSPAEPLAGVTAPLDLEHLGALRARGPTPFKGTTTPERIAELKQEAAATAPAPSSDAAHGGTDETAMYMPSAAERAAFAPLPFTTPARPAPAPPRELTLDELASLAAQLQVRPGSAEVLARFGIRTQAELLAVHTDQERRFTADPSLRKLFEERRAHFLSFMNKEPRR